MGDFSSQNFLIDKNEQLRAIDFESYFEFDKDELSTLFQAAYSSTEHAAIGTRDPYSDYFGFCATALDAPFPIAQLRQFDGETWMQVVRAIADDCGVDLEAVDAMLCIARGEPLSSVERGAVANAVQQAGGTPTRDQRPTPSASGVRDPSSFPHGAADTTRSNQVVNHVRDRIARLIEQGQFDAEYTTSRSGIRAHPASLGHGMSGAALLFGAEASERSRAVRNTIGQRLLHETPDEGAGGLLFGWYGTAWATRPDATSDWYRSLTTDRLLQTQSDASLYSGSAGLLLAQLDAHLRAEGCRYLTSAAATADWLLMQCDLVSSETPFPCSSEHYTKSPLGLLHGRTGAALALWHASRLMAEDHASLGARCLRQGALLMEQECSWLDRSGGEAALAKVGVRGQEGAFSPHWGTGSGGLAAVLALYASTGDSACRAWQKPVLRSTAIPWTTNPSLQNGLAGLIHSFLSVDSSGLQLSQGRRLAFIQATNAARFADREGRFPCSENISVESDDLLTGATGLALVLDELAVGRRRLAFWPGKDL